jgi:2-hydroxychromene-2-carboxylate isomerase
MKVTHDSDMIFLEATGAEVPALYRAYLEDFGEHDGTTKQVFEAVVNRRDWTDEIDSQDANEVIGALDAAGMSKMADLVEEARCEINENWLP